MAAVQVPALVGTGILTWRTAGFGLAALAIVFAAMPLGAWLARHVSREAFDRLILALLAAIAVRLVWQALG